MAKEKKLVEQITSMEEDFAQWYTDVVKKAELIAYEDLGAEALRKLYVEDMPLFVIIDCEGNNLYDEGRKAYLDTQDK